jgi:energy-coupling factor transporter ATP-binding protein EcfA2
MIVEENGLPAQITQVSRKEIRERVHRALELVDMAGFRRGWRHC